MLDSYYRLSVPEDLSTYYRVTDVIRKMDVQESINFNSDVVVARDSQGCISSVSYFTSEHDLVKEVFYKGEDISKINYYRGKILYSTEGYKDGLLALKFIFKSNGYLDHSFEYEYNKKSQISSICKKLQGREVLVVYKYDEFDRIMLRKIYLNSEKVLEQYYGYDILDRIKEYKDDNQHIIVNSVSQKNELLSYVITDKMGNEIKIENHFTERGYTETEITVNGHCSKVKDTSYVDNVMLKKPYTNEDDLDLIIANLFGGAKPMQTTRTRENEVEKRSVNLIDKGIEQRVLPISMRKRLLYNNVVSRVS